MSTVPTQLETLAHLRASIADAHVDNDSSTLPFGVSEIDERLADNGLSTLALHEVAAAEPSLADDAAATLFVAGLAARLAASSNTRVLWAISRFDLYAPGLEQVGLKARHLLFAEARDDKEVLAVMEDGLRHGSLAAVVGEIRRADMTASRRLQLAAAAGRTPALLSRRWRRQGRCPLTDLSAATTRWRIGCAPSARLFAPGVGHPRWQVELARQRNGNPFSLLVESCDATGRLGLPSAIVDRAAPSIGAAAHAA